MKAVNSKMGKLKQDFVTRTGGETEKIAAALIEVVAEDHEEEAEEEEKKEEEEEEEIILTPDQTAEILVDKFFQKFLI